MTHMWQEILETPTALENCMQRNDAALDALVHDIEARQIRFVVMAARGTSDHAALYGKYVIEQLLGLPVSMAASSIYTLYGASLRLDHTLVIGISQSGKAEDVAEVLRNAKQNGALTLGITNFSDSPIAQLAHHHLCCEAGLEKSVAATKTFTTQMCLLAKLAARWAKDDAFEQALATLPARIGEGFELAADVEQVAARFRFVQGCFVLARGTNYAIARESALKLQETTYVRAMPFASSDFRHGPIAMVDRNIPAIIYAPEGPSTADLTELIERLKQNDVETLVITNSDRMAALGTCSLRIPQTDNDLISPFFNAIIAQMFACRVSLAKGLNPDSPRGLKKVTITK